MFMERSSIGFILLLIFITIFSPLTQTASELHIMGNNRDSSILIIKINGCEIKHLFKTNVKGLISGVYFDGKWYFFPVYIWNKSDTVYVGKDLTLKVPKRGYIHTNNTQLLIKLPITMTMKNNYVKEWPLQIALKHLHRRAFIKLNDHTSFYIFYDHIGTNGWIKYIRSIDEYNRFISSGRIYDLKALETTIHKEYVSSFLIDGGIPSRIIGYNISRNLYEKLLKSSHKPLWYVNDDRGNDGASNPSPHDQIKYYISIIDTSTNLSDPLIVSRYVGTQIYDISYYGEFRNHYSSPRDIIITFKVIDNPTSEILGEREYTLRINPYSDIDIMLLPPIVFMSERYLNYTVLIESPGEIEVKKSYFVLSKYYGDQAYNLLKAMKIGFNSRGGEHNPNGWFKHYGDLGINEALILTSHLPNGLITSCDLDGYGFKMHIQYDIDTPNSIIIKMNGYRIVDEILVHSSQPNMYNDIWINLSYCDLKEIIKGLLQNDENLLLTIESPLLRDEDAMIHIVELTVDIPFYPEVWKYNSWDFIRYQHIIAQGSTLIYKNTVNLVSEPVGVFTSYIIANEGSSPHYGSYHIQTYISASRTNWSQDKISEVDVKMYIDKTAVNGFLPTYLDVYISLKDQDNENLDEVVKAVKHIYNALRVIGKIFSYFSDGVRSVFELGDTFIDFLDELIAHIYQEPGYSEGKYNVYHAKWKAGLQPASSGRFVFKADILLNNNANGLSHDLEIIVKIYVKMSDGSSNYIVLYSRLSSIAVSHTLEKHYGVTMYSID